MCSYKPFVVRTFIVLLLVAASLYALCYITVCGNTRITPKYNPRLNFTFEVHIHAFICQHDFSPWMCQGLLALRLSQAPYPPLPPSHTPRKSISIRFLILCTQMGTLCSSPELPLRAAVSPPLLPEHSSRSGLLEFPTLSPSLRLSVRLSL